MAPSVSLLPETQESSVLQAKKNGLSQNGTQYEVSENYDGDYRFAPIEEAQVSRAMIKR
jgi:cysteine-dependent adenosine diphosphate thiazole synthase